MSVLHAREGRLRAALVTGILTSFLIGCGGDSSSSAGNSSTNPKTAARRKENADFLLKNEPAAEKK
jgi:hypothetical protein